MFKQASEQIIIRIFISMFWSLQSLEATGIALPKNKKEQYFWELSLSKLANLDSSIREERLGSISSIVNDIMLPAVVSYPLRRCDDINMFTGKKQDMTFSVRYNAL